MDARRVVQLNDGVNWWDRQRCCEHCSRSIVYHYELVLHFLTHVIWYMELIRSKLPTTNWVYLHPIRKFIFKACYQELVADMYICKLSCVIFQLFCLSTLSIFNKLSRASQITAKAESSVVVRMVKTILLFNFSYFNSYFVNGSLWCFRINFMIKKHGNVVKVWILHTYPA